MLATPYLYETLEWEHMLRDPTVVVKEGKAIRGSAKDWITRNENVRHIKMVHVRQHDIADCPRTLLTDLRRPLRLPFVRIDYQHETPYDRFYTCRRCPLLNDLAPRRLVLTTLGAEYFPSPLANRPIEDIVLHFNLPKNLPKTKLSGPVMRYYAKRLIVILSLSEDENRQGSQLQRDSNLNQVISRLANYLTYIVLDYVFRSAVLVNFDTLNDHSVVDAKGVFETAYRARFEERQAVAKAGKDTRPIDRDHSTSARLASISHSFISMKEYLTTFDWEGVYTKAEVDRMLKEPALKLGEEE